MKDVIEIVSITTSLMEWLACKLVYFFIPLLHQEET